MFSPGWKGTMAVLTTKMAEYRKRLGITQAELATRCGCRRETIVKLEAGKYNPSLKQQLQAIILSNLMASTGWDIEKAMEKLGIPIGDRQKMESLMEELGC